jgi:hypothetical protein
VQVEIVSHGPDLDAYYRSIKPAFEKTLEAQEMTAKMYDGSSTTAAFSFFLVLSVIPVLPGLLYIVFRWIGKPLSIFLWGRAWSVNSFVFWYVGLAAISALLLGIRLRYSSYKQEKSRPKTKKDELLADAQMRFALCYSVMVEIEAYRTNKIPVHIEHARLFWRKLIISLRSSMGSDSSWFFDPTYEIEERYSLAPSGRIRPKRSGGYGVFFPQIQNLKTSFKWFHLEVATAKIVDAFNGLRSKLNDRIADRKDLAQVSSCLLSLSEYLYAQIPDIADTEEDKKKLSYVEDQSLTQFAEKMSQLTKYLSENRRPLVSERSAKAAVKKEKLGNLIAATVANPAPFLRFSSIWVVIQIIVATAVLILLWNIKNLKFDSTLIALVVGTPFAVAAGITAIPLAPKKISS